MNTSNKLIGGRGAKRILATVAYSGIKREALVAEGSCVVTSCTGEDGNGNAINFKTHKDFIWTEFEPGVTYTVHNKWFISAITLTSGNAVLY